jgi:hypothetical protein
LAGPRLAWRGLSEYGGLICARNRVLTRDPTEGREPPDVRHGGTGRRAVEQRGIQSNEPAPIGANPDTGDAGEGTA